MPAQGMKKNARAGKKMLTGREGSYRYPLLPDGENASPGGTKEKFIYMLTGPLRMGRTNIRMKKSGKDL